MGLSGTKLYASWANMKARCYDPKTNRFECYGGRGIGVCDEWMEFRPFFDWAIANGYKLGLSIDRIDNDRGYSPDNCRWVTRKAQQKNKRNSVGRGPTSRTSIVLNKDTVLHARALMSSEGRNFCSLVRWLIRKEFNAQFPQQQAA